VDLRAVPPLETEPRPSSTRLVLVLGALTALGPLSIDLYLPAFPSVARALGTSVAAVQLTLATYLVGLAVGQLVYGPLSDRYGRRPPLLAGLGLYVAGALACASAPSLAALAAARFAQALGGCAGLVVSRAVVRDRFDVRDSARVFSSLMLVMGAAPILAPLAGAQLLAALGWRAIFLALAVAAGALALVVALLLPESLPPAGRSTAGLGGALSGFRAALASRAFVRLSISAGASQAAMFAYIAGSPLVFIEHFGVRPDRFGLVFGANALGLIAASQLNRWLAARIGVVAALRGGIVLALVADAALWVAVRTGGGLPLVLPALFVGIATVGVALPNATALAMGLARRDAGGASAVLGLLQSGCGAVAAALVTALADGTPRPMAVVMIGCAIVAGVAAAFD
jgi:DHA1 family bicyclomycin/chloramphenicol resistance-like MFS transporter